MVTLTHERRIGSCHHWYTSYYYVYEWMPWEVIERRFRCNDERWVNWELGFLASGWRFRWRNFLLIGFHDECTADRGNVDFNKNPENVEFNISSYDRTYALYRCVRRVNWNRNFPPVRRISYSVRSNVLYCYEV